MSQVQRAILGAGVVVLVGLACYVPWIFKVNSNGTHKESPAGYSLIFDSPKPDEHDAKSLGFATRFISVQMDLPRIIFPMAIAVLATLAGMLLTRGLNFSRSMPSPAGATTDSDQGIPKPVIPKPLLSPFAAVTIVLGVALFL